MTTEDIKRYTGTCVFFDADKSHCRAGVDYEDVEVRSLLHFFNKRSSLPCVPVENEFRATCRHLKLPTLEQVERHVKWTDAREAAIKTVLQVSGGLCGVTGFITCPICGGEMRYAVLPFSGKITFQCLRITCLAFEE